MCTSFHAGAFHGRLTVMDTDLVVLMRNIFARESATHERGFPPSVMIHTMYTVLSRPLSTGRVPLAGFGCHLQGGSILSKNPPGPFFFKTEFLLTLPTTLAVLPWPSGGARQGALVILIGPGMTGPNPLGHLSAPRIRALPDAGSSVLKNLNKKFAETNQSVDLSATRIPTAAREPQPLPAIPTKFPAVGRPQMRDGLRRYVVARLGNNTHHRRLVYGIQSTLGDCVVHSGDLEMNPHVAHGQPSKHGDSVALDSNAGSNQLLAPTRIVERPNSTGVQLPDTECGTEALQGAYWPAPELTTKRGVWIEVVFTALSSSLTCDNLGTVVDAVPIVVFDSVAVVATISLALTLAPAAFASNVHRSKAWRSMIATMMVFPLFYLLNVGSQFNTDTPPPIGLCILQSGFIYAGPPACTTAVLCFLTDTTLGFRALLFNGKRNQFVSKALILLPSILFACVFFEAIVLVNGDRGVHFDSAHMFCESNTKGPQVKISAVLTVISLCFTLCMEVWTMAMLYRNWAAVRLFRHAKGDLQLPVMIRFGVFTLVVGFAAVLGAVTLPNNLQGGAIWNIFLVAVPLFAALAFGTR
ncbi:hypothetical protein C8R43DRAFT_1108803, partial [Mycena crocata]